LPGSPADPADGTLHLQLPNRRAALETARQAVLDFIAGHGLSPRAVYRLELVLEEVWMNLVMHAFPDGGEQLVDLHLQLEPDAVALVVEDDGVAFDPLAAPPPQRPASLDEAVPGGLGLSLMRSACRSMAYTRIGGRNRLQVQVDRQ